MNENNEKTTQEKAKRFSNIKGLVVSSGIGAMLGNAAFGIWDKVNAGFDCSETVIAVGCVALFATGVALIQNNPYTNQEITTEDKELEQDEKPKVKKLQK